MEKPSKVLCICSKCRGSWSIVDGEERRGRLLRPKTVEQHKEDDAWTRRVHEDEGETEISSAILLASASEPPSTDRSQTLPVRHRDKATEGSGSSSVRDTPHIDLRHGIRAGSHSASASEEAQDMGMSDSSPEAAGRGNEVASRPPSPSAPEVRNLICSLFVHTALNTERDKFQAIEVAKRRLKLLSDLQSLVDTMCKSVPNGTKLTFDVVPTSLEDSAPEPSSPGFGTLNAWIEDQIRYVSQEVVPIGDRDMDQRRLALLRRLRSEVDRLTQLKETAWARHVATHIIRSHMRDSDEKGPKVIEVDPLKGISYAATLQPYVLAGLLMATVLHSLAATARLPVQYVLQVLQVVLHGAFMFCNSSFGRKATLTPDQHSILASIPIGIDTVIENLDLEPDIIRFACCPTCHSTYAPDRKKPTDPYPHTCTHQETDKPVCGTTLVYAQRHSPKRKKGVATITYEPFMVFPFRSPISWISDFVRRPGIRTLLQHSWDRKDSPAGTVRDILDSEAVRGFLGPDGKTPFSSQPEGSLHLVFSLFVDWFNPFGNKKAGKSHSVGVIYLALQNLPDHLRYRAENMCLIGTIPGPHEPELHQLNHFLRPLVDELLVLWHRGLHLTETGKDDILLFIRAALIPLVCDVPALRKAGGFAGHMSSHFCSFCELPKASINELDRKKWPRHGRDRHLRYATRWRDAGTEAARDAEFKAHGIRWSELLRLEYWDPTKFAVVDAMHNLFLGELRHHCRDVWGLDIKDKGGDGQQLDPHTPEQQRIQLERIRSALTGGHRNPLDKVRKGYIIAVAQVNGVLPADGNPAKKAYVDALLAWAKNNATVKLPRVLDEPTTDFAAHNATGNLPKSRIIDRDTIEQIRSDISATHFPSWMERSPRNFGSPSHGKLKADQWRTVCTVSLVITLVRLWGVSGAPEERKQLLDNFIHLVCAVDLATRRSMFPDRVARFDEHMSAYLSSLRSLFNHQLVPNHHLSLHLHEFLQLFGPVHGWWTFPFERFNGLLQRLNTNSRPEHMPLTFMRYFCIGANLRSFLTGFEWPNTKTFKAMVNAFTEAFSSISSGTRIGDFMGSGDRSCQPSLEDYDEDKEERLQPVVYDKLIALLSSAATPFSSTYASDTHHPILNDKVNYLSRIRHSGVTFASQRSGVRDSFIVFEDIMRDGSAETFPSAGKIIDIFLHARAGHGQPTVEYFAVVEEYTPLSDHDATQDPYRRFPDLQTRLFYRRTRSSPHVIRLEAIRAHFAALFYKPDGIDEECVVVRSLDRS